MELREIIAKVAVKRIEEIVLLKMGEGSIIGDFAMADISPDLIIAI